MCLAAIPAIRGAGFTGTLHMSSCSEYVDKLPADQVDGIINHNEFYYPTFTSIPAKPASDLAIFQRYMKRDVPNLQSIVYGELGFHIAVQAADMLRQVQGDITPQTVRATMPHTKGPMFFRDSQLGVRLLEGLLAAGLRGVLRGRSSTPGPPRTGRRSRSTSTRSTAAPFGRPADVTI